MKKIADGLRPSRSKARRSASNETLGETQKVKFANEPYEEIGFGSPLGEIIESLHPSEASTPAANFPDSPIAPITASTTVVEEKPIVEQIFDKDTSGDSALAKIPGVDTSEISPTMLRHKQEVVEMIKGLGRDYFAETKRDDDVILPSQLTTKYAWVNAPPFNTAAFEEKFIRVVFFILLIPFMILQYLFMKIVPKTDNPLKK